MRKQWEKVKMATSHVIDCIDGEKEPPRWLHRSHRVGHILFLGSGVAIAFGAHSVEILHYFVMGGVCFVECLTFVLGTSFEGFEEIDPD
jgi:hypothetical protein